MSVGQGLMTLLIVAVVLTAIVVGHRASGQAPDAKQGDKAPVLEQWSPPMGKAPHIGQGVSAGPKLYGASVVTSVPFKELWLHYAKKCGYEKDYPERGILTGDEKGRYLIQDGILSATWERGTSFLCNVDQYIVSVVLIPRERAGVSVMITVLEKQ